MRTNFFLIIILLIFLISCKDEKTLEELPVIFTANFTTIDTLYSPQEWVEFQNIGDSVANYYWEFGDGHSSTERNPKHFYLKPGTYNVKLKTIDEQENIDSIIKQIRVGEWFAYQVVLLHLDEYKYYKKEEYWDEDSVGIHALPDVYFEIKGTIEQEHYTSETYYNLQSNDLPLSFKIPNVKIEPWFTDIDETSISINLNERDGDKYENIMTSFDHGSTSFKYDRLSRMGEFTIHAGASFKVLYTVK